VFYCQQFCVIEGIGRQCGIAELMLYYVTFCILVWVLSVLRSAMLCSWKEMTDSAVWQGECCIV